MIPTTVTDEELVRMARDAAAGAYAPYSGFRVGAALLCQDGTVVTGANVENASYGLSLCAERVALSTARGRGLAGFRTMAVFAGGGVPPWPCGACRQVAWELAPALRFIIAAEGRAPATVELTRLLPHPFTLEDRA
jgi:homotetrameric cytidine deaminase